MKKSIIIALAIALLLISACGRVATPSPSPSQQGTIPSASPSSSPSASPSGAPNASPSGSPGMTGSELERRYTEAITAARTDEYNKNNAIRTSGEGMDDATWELLGITKEDVDALAASVSLMNVRAYAVVAAMPSEGKEENVSGGLQTYMDRQKGSFEQYLPDQYEIASAARLGTLADGTVLLVMSEGQDEVYASIANALQPQASQRGANVL